MRVAVFNDTRSDGHFGCTLVMRQISRLLAEQDIEVAWFWPVGRNWHGEVDLTGLDGIVVNGEGTLHRTAERDRARWLCELAPFAAEAGIPAFLINAGIHELDPESARGLAAYSGIYVRDRYSQDALKHHGIPSDVVPDLSMSAEFPAFPGQRRGVLVTDSVLPEVTDRLRFTARLRRWRWRSLRFQKKGKLRLASCLSDLPWFLANRRDPETLPDRFAAFTASHSFVVTGRYHMVAYCLLTGTPFVAVESNTPKICSLLSDVFREHSRLVKPDCLATLNPKCFAWLDVEEKEMALESYLTRCREGARAMFSHIRATLDGERAVVNTVRSS